QALITVFNKAGLPEFARELVERHGIEILSTGGTAKLLQNEGIPCTEVSEFTGSPEMMDGRVKIIHPKVFGGILYVRDNEEHFWDARTNKIVPIDMVVVDLYPFEEKSTSGAPHEEIVENIDIGGPSALRAGAKNYRSVTVISYPEDYEIVLRGMEENESATTLEIREYLASRVFLRMAIYEMSICVYFAKRRGLEIAQKTLGGFLRVLKGFIKSIA
ncbi:MAG: bifunctional phosphoribosylaminoimidazolecarboxamide formyltransferase/IMP cyclohydrolase, partial [bacterium]